MTHIFILSGSALLTVILIVALRAWAVRLGLVDHPGERKSHEGIVPIHGGLCMALAMLAVMPLLKWGMAPDPYEWSLILGVAFFVMLGFVDDRFNLSAGLRLCIETGFLFGLMWFLGFKIQYLGDLWGMGDIHLHSLAIPFTLFTIFCIINGLNMLDGMDGLAGGITVIALCWFYAAASLVSVVLTPLLLAALGAVLGFLVLNIRFPWRKRAFVFMGDTGSLVLGFVLAWSSVVYSQVDMGDAAFVIRPMTAVWILALPVLDTVYVVIHRVRAGTGIFTPGRDHIHHRLQERGLSDTATVSLLWLASVLTGGIGVMSDYFEIPEYIMCYGFIGLSVVYYQLASKMPHPGTGTDS